ncbi:RsiV family protein [Chryseobacterium sp.]|uniref:RsiV family protein n=1 Tax=Chryseobacterium sp. TaxID=1871047 RepID=UPI00289A93BC|nr:RsiV family protein [Chryseobacterium sp.]
MKKTVLFFGVLASLFFVSCKKEKKTTEESVTSAQSPEKFVIDSVSVEDSTKISDKLALEYSSDVLVYPSVKDKALLDSIYFIYKGITDFSKKGLQDFLQKDKTDYFTETKNQSKEWIADLNYPQTWNTSFKMSQISQNENFLQIEYLSSAYEGGAHDNYWFSNRVFDLKNNKKLVLSDITTMPSAKLSQILRKNMDNIHSGTTDSKGEVKNSDMLLVDVIPPNENFYFDEKNLYFHYSPYEIAAFAAGDITIPVSWIDLKETLKPDFAQKMNLQ